MNSTTYSLVVRIAARPAIVVTVAMLAACARGKPVGRLGVTPKETTVAVGACASLRFEWTPAAPLDHSHGRPFVFVHLLAPPGNPPGNFDHPLPETWTPGRPQSYEKNVCPSDFSTALRPGTYRLTVGLYDVSWGYRWPLEGGGPEVDRREYLMGTITVTAKKP
jgi:hypothetical protein